MFYIYSMILTAQTSLPVSAPVSLGGTTPSLLCGSSMLLATMKVITSTASCALIYWNVDFGIWVKYPSAAVALDPAVDDGIQTQSYVMPKTPDGIYIAYLATTIDGTVTVSSILANT